ncbi:diphthamide biosynthesis protein 2 [Sporothrix schenckii 1099-18]|uniref:2-(3-amino-3-carboxypropyl)histidine synthase subunit 2 n=1 Tax=Sporothrix schenckii 1099-18 TaxID=1397361 RepID=A0A0F2MMS8_SPOSC|nr:diphthamide biosynthesis protein 2 [Sporothrix schenckii 1099-18]KJR89476.1 diphthamide biosynthesis protein 2 [Sporothrix schenckii 1099-18]
MAELKAAPVLSTPAENLFDQVEPVSVEETPRRSDDELRAVYEVARTAREIRAGNRKCVALQFPDAMLGDSPRVVKLLREELTATAVEIESGVAASEKVYILADTSYSACCVDEVAAEHADADVVVHYGRSCLSPTSRLPVIYVFTQHELDEDAVVQSFAKELGAPQEGNEGDDSEGRQNVVIMADVTYQDHVAPVADRLRNLGYKNVLATKVVHRPLGSIPNRTIVGARDGAEVKDEDVDLHEYAVFHIAQPPTSLLLALAARVKAFYIYATTDTDNSAAGSLLAPRTMGLLGRRYAKVLTMATAGVIGILVNTLSVNNYLKAVDAIRKRIADAGKKSYLIVVGKLNPVKLANFAEIEGWVVVGCWESSLVEDDAGFYQPVVTPFELEMALMSDDERIWGHKWWGGLEALTTVPEPETNGEPAADAAAPTDTTAGNGAVSDEEDSEVPQFDLRTGRLVTTSRPMRNRGPNAKNVANRDRSTIASSSQNPNGGALALRSKAGELATINGVASPGAEFLRSQRTWQGLGTEFDDEDVVASTAVEEGRSGIARGYTVGEEAQPRT